MDDNDILKDEDIVVVRVALLKERRKVLAAATIVPILAAVIVWLSVYHFKFHNVTASTFIAAVFSLIGVPVFVHWWRHYRSVLAQLESVAKRVASGEIVYGSKIAFHSYRSAP